MSWGEQYWGGFTETIAARYLYLNRDAPRFRAIANVLDEHYTNAIQVLQDLEVAFDLDTAVGNQLDILGALLGLERNGFVDERYRRALKVQRWILASTGVRDDYINVWTDWTGTAPTGVRSAPPATFIIEGHVEPEDEYLLWQFLKTVAGAGIVLIANVVDEDLSVLICDSVVTALADPGTLDNQPSDLHASAAILAHSVDTP